MFAATFFSVALFIAPAIRGVLADNFEINTVNITQCQDAQVTWSGGQSPYNLIVVPANDTCGDAIADLGDHNGTSMTWLANIPAGQQVVLSLADENGDEAWSGNILVQGSSNSSCLPNAPSAASSAPASARTTLSVAYSGGAAAPSSAPSSGPAAVPVGAANAGSNPTSGSSISIQRISTTTLGLTVLAAVLGLAL